MHYPVCDASQAALSDARACAPADCTVGLMFALLPLFAGMSKAGDAAASWRAAAVAVPYLLAKLLLFGAACLALAQFFLPTVHRTLAARFSRELGHLTLVGFCFAVAHASDRAGLSSELGAFLAGVMASVAESRANRGAYVASADSQSGSPLRAVGGRCAGRDGRSSSLFVDVSVCVSASGERSSGAMLIAWCIAVPSLSLLHPMHAPTPCPAPLLSFSAYSVS